ncbi:MAG TPA: gephyrin-like molybdotransferase Glp [Anaerolineales bacterium]|nr:gephyrin-like molybdotransferase Glp [Anaerolineales bacterium]
MRSVEEARSLLLAAVEPLDVEEVPLEAAAGRVLARPVVAGFDLPAFSNSSMDGFALRAADIAGASASAPRRLPVIADIPAGAEAVPELEAGQAARIMTGAPLPPGADTVVPVEKTDFGVRFSGAAAPVSVQIYAAVGPGGYVRQRGEDVAAGEMLLEPGVRLRPQDVGMAAMTGTAAVAVHRKPRAAVLSTGDELLRPGEPPAPGKIFESNSLTLSALLGGAGADVDRIGIARDSAQDVRDKLDAAAAAGVDLIVSSAGVSVGAYDFVKEVVEQHGRLEFWKVNMRPGKPLAFGFYREVLFIGLPGNPVSAFVGFEVFLRPLLAKLSGWSAWERETFAGQIEAPIESDGRESYLRARAHRETAGWRLALTGHQGSGNQFSLVRANAIAIIPAGVNHLDAGEQIEFWRFSQ